jgi:hypothetical protein
MGRWGQRPAPLSPGLRVWGHPLRGPLSENASPGLETIIVALLRYGRLAYSPPQSLFPLSHLSATLIESALYVEETGILGSETCCLLILIYSPPEDAPSFLKSLPTIPYQLIARDLGGTGGPGSSWLLSGPMISCHQKMAGKRYSFSYERPNTVIASGAKQSLFYP